MPVGLMTETIKRDSLEGKDLDRDGEAGHLAARKGLLDYSRSLSLRKGLDFDVPMILHGLTEEKLPESVAFVHEKMQALNP